MAKAISFQKIIAGLISLGLVSVFAMPAIVGAQADIDPTLTDFGLTDPGFEKVGVKSTRDIKDTLAQIINIILGFLGVIAVIIILAGGFKWMTAGGNEDKVAESRKMIVQGVIGLVVIFAAWAIASFVITQLRAIQLT